jgi:3-deoxy-D-manno-octulosonic-acid transferase
MLFNLAYLIALTLASPWIAYRVIRHGRYRRGATQKLLGLSRRDAARLTRGLPCRWIHAVSVGEVNLLPSIVQNLQRLDPSHVVVISTSTDTGYDLAVQRFGADRVFFCPLDFTWATRRTFRHLNCRHLILTELELWPNLIAAATKAKVPVDVVNARLSERSAKRYASFRWLTRKTFARLRHVGCQDEATRDGFIRCGSQPNAVTQTGSLKFDNAPDSRDTADVQGLIAWSGIDPWHRVWVLGSSGPGEESMALRIYKQLVIEHPELRLIIVPRHRERFDSVAAEIQNEGFLVHRRKQDRSLADAQWSADRVILVDTIGELRSWWGVANIATVGGSFGRRGGQNMLEPAGYGCALSFGPDTRNFRVIADQLIQGNAAIRTLDENELCRFVKRCLSDVPAADELGRSAQKIVQSHRGALQRTLQLLQESVKQAA